MNIIRIAILVSAFAGSMTLKAQVKWEPLVDMDSQLFPSYVIATATMDFEKLTKKPLPSGYLGDRNGQIGIAIVAPAQDVKLELEISSTRFIKKTTFKTVLKESGKAYKIYPLIEYDFEALYATREPVPETVTYSLKVSGMPEETKKKVIQVRAIADCPYLYAPSKDNVVDMTWMFAAYVNENHPKIDQILRTAMKTGLVDNFAGYQGSKQDVLREVAAIWTAFQSMGFRYSSITTPSGYAPRVYSQHVRFVGDSLASSQANCVDGSVLFASVLRKIGLKPYLVIVPGHCFVGVWLDKERKAHVAIETTMLGSTKREKYLNDKDPLSGLLSGLTGAKTKNQASMISFDQAVKVATNRLTKDSDKFFGPNKDGQHKLIDLESARKMGVLPLKEIEVKGQ